MEFEVGKLYVTENCEYLKGCVFEFIGRKVGVVKFEVIKPNANLEYTEQISFDYRNAERIGFKPAALRSATSR